jgi:hypothetical protein
VLDLFSAVWHHSLDPLIYIASGALIAAAVMIAVRSEQINKCGQPSHSFDLRPPSSVSATEDPAYLHDDGGISRS